MRSPGLLYFISLLQSSLLYVIPIPMITDTAILVLIAHRYLCIYLIIRRMECNLPSEKNELPTRGRFYILGATKYENKRQKNQKFIF